MNFYLSEIKKIELGNTFSQKMKYMFNGRGEKYPELLIQKRPGKYLGRETLQMCRSASEWSIGVQPTQH
jgi:hypothetical protein